MDKITLKKKRLVRRKLKIKNKLNLKNREEYRLCISKSNKTFYAQIIDDKKGHTLVAMSTLSKEFGALKSGGNIEAAKALGKATCIMEKLRPLLMLRVKMDWNFRSVEHEN